MATPAIRAVRERYPTARLIGVGRPYISGALAGNPWFDRWIDLNRSWWDILRVSAALRREYPDAAVMFPNSFRQALIARLVGCGIRIGTSRYGRGWLLTHRTTRKRDASGRYEPSPAIDTYNGLVELLDCRPNHRMELFTTFTDERNAQEAWIELGLYRFPRVIALNTGGAFGAAKQWPLAHFVALARSFAFDHGFGVLVVCGPAEREAARAIVRGAEHPAVTSLADRMLSLGLTKACIRRSALLVTTDSGPRHFAAAFNRPVVTLFGPTHIQWTETYFDKAVHLQRKVPCGPCQQRVCPTDHRCMRELSPEEVRKAALRLLNESSGEKRDAG